jgi:formylglycine-generating enzyme required for sulfatase activity
VPPTFTPTPTITPDPLQAAFTPVARNADWTPVERDFDGVTMVLVPAGCFDMGSTTEQIDYAVNALGANREGMDDEQPVYEQCFDEPFWIDKYEVTNEQFELLDGEAQFSSFRTVPNLPRENIAWQEANLFCNSREGYLPSEAQWAFAARGPDALIFPWGNEFDENNVAFAGNTVSTVEGNAYTDGASWVGALNMSGNVWEWTSSIYGLYGFEEDTSEDNPFRVIRGGSIFVDDSVYAANRAGSQRWSTLTGFRCARDYDG